MLHVPWSHSEIDLEHFWKKNNRVFTEFYRVWEPMFWCVCSFFIFLLVADVGRRPVVADDGGQRRRRLRRRRRRLGNGRRRRGVAVPQERRRRFLQLHRRRSQGRVSAVPVFFCFLCVCLFFFGFLCFISKFEMVVAFALLSVSFIRVRGRRWVRFFQAVFIDMR